MLDYMFDKTAVINALNLDDMPAEVQDKIIGGLFDQLEDAVRIRTLGSLSQEELEAFNELSGSNLEAAKQWLVERFPNYVQIYEEELGEIIDSLNRQADAVVNSVPPDRSLQ
jgi:hypothetical protein